MAILSILGTPVTQKLSQRERITAIIGLAVLLFLIFAGANKFGSIFLHLNPLASRDLFWWSMLFVTLGYVRLVEGRSLASIGIVRPRVMTAVSGIAAALVMMFVAFPLAGAIVSHLHLSTHSEQAAASIYGHTPAWYRWLLVTRAALVEEVVFRGYLIERTENVTGSSLLAAILSIVTFCFAHLAFWGWQPLIGIAVGAVPLVALYLWRRDLWACILAHWVTDVVGVIL